MRDLSFLVPARNEMWLSKTVESILAKIRGNSDIIVVLDGEWADPPLHEHPRVTIIHKSEPIGQRAATNLAARISDARYVCKLDAHCDIDEGFDVKLVEAGDQLGKDVTQIPAQYNLHAFNWRCNACGVERYQGPTPSTCIGCGRPGPFERVVYWDLEAGGDASQVWTGGRKLRTEFWRFDHDLHFQYWDKYRKRPEAQGDIVDVMSSVGACFVMRRDRFVELGGLDEAHGSWGNFGTEIACKSWLSGGRHVVNKSTWFAHLFRTQGADFGFPYVNPGSAIEKARAHSRQLWLENTWPGQARPLSWLIDKFAPVPGWHDADGEKRLRQVRRAGETFRFVPTDRWHARLGPVAAETTVTSPVTGGLSTRPPLFLGREGIERVIFSGAPRATTPTKGLVYYTDNRLDDAPVGKAVRQRLAATGLPIVSVSLKPIAFGRNVVLPLERGHLTMFRQILAGLEALDTDIAFLVEHDVLYAPEHFGFIPPRDDRFYYNQHRWQVSAADGKAVHYRASQTSGCCAYRQLLVEHYRKRVAYVEQHGWDRNLGYEPGTNGRSREFDPHGADVWMTAQPNIDVRDIGNLSKSKWSIADFRNKANAIDWTEGDGVPGWGTTRGRFPEFLAEISA